MHRTLGTAGSAPQHRICGMRQGSVELFMYKKAAAVALACRLFRIAPSTSTAVSDSQLPRVDMLTTRGLNSQHHEYTVAAQSVTDRSPHGHVPTSECSPRVSRIRRMSSPATRSSTANSSYGTQGADRAKVTLPHTRWTSTFGISSQALTHKNSGLLHRKLGGYSTGE